MSHSYILSLPLKLLLSLMLISMVRGAMVRLSKILPRLDMLAQVLNTIMMSRERSVIWIMAPILLI